MRILVISDSHGNPEFIDRVVEKESNVCQVIFCGDGLSDFMYANFSKKFPLIKVSGNVDRLSGSDLDSESLITLNKKKLFITHGDKYFVKSGYNHLLKKAMDLSVNIVIFGHTHEQYFATKGNIFLFNPGSLRNGDYGILEINEKISAYHKNIF